MDWYEEYIENGIRNEVKLLRDSGFNTECSCEHKKYIQCSYIPDETIKRLDDLLFNNNYRDYTITVNIQRISGFLYSFMEVVFGFGKPTSRKRG